MAGIPTDYYGTDMAEGQREDVSDLIHNISPTETPCLSLFGTTSAGAVLHQWQVDTLVPPAANIQNEGDDATETERSPTVMRSNHTQISAKFFNVTGTLEVTEKYGRDSELAYQAAKAARELKTDVDLSISGLNQASKEQDASGRQSGDLETWIETNISEGVGATGGGWSGGVTTVRAGTVTTRPFTQALLDGVIQLGWDQGAKPSVILCGAVQKTNLSGFDGVGTGNSSSTIQRSDRSTRTIIATADLYVSNFGELRVVPSRHMRKIATFDAHVFCLDPEYAKVAYLRPWQQFDLAKDGDSIKREMLVEWTLEMCNEKAHCAVYDLNDS
jgi:hypothetical protein